MSFFLHRLSHIFLCRFSYNTASIINGGAGNQTITGSTLDDIIAGGLGDDNFTGGSGADFFIVNSGKDTITDLELVFHLF